MEQKLLDYHIKETNKSLDDIYEEISEIRKSISQFSEFKVSMIAQTRVISLVVSAACGLLTMVATIAAEYFMKK